MVSDASNMESWTFDEEHLAICRITASDERGVSQRGTGTHVGAGFVLTALHVIASSRLEPKFYPTITMEFEGCHSTLGSTAPSLWNIENDWAILRLLLPVGEQNVQLPSLPMSELTQGEVGVSWKSYGFPVVRPTGMNFSGTVTGYVRMGNARAIQLYSVQAAARDGVLLEGLSGAPIVVQGSVVGIVRSAILDEGLPVGGVIFACPSSALIAGDLNGSSSLPDEFPGPDIYRGLPGIPRRDLPERPFRYLDRYTDRDAEIFFGRGETLRTIYSAIVAQNADSILLIFGQSGIGKSSLIEAGLLPRLATAHGVRLVRRSEVESLTAALHKSTDGDWRALEASAGMPIISVIDQVEEVFTIGNADPKLELESFAAQLERIFGTSTVRPRGKLILSLRKEWLAEIEALLQKYRLPHSKHFVERLTRDEIIEVVEGLTFTSRLRRHYNVTVERDLGDRIAADLLSDLGSAVTPMLQVWMTRLWELSKDEKERRHFNVASYQSLRRQETHLDDFVRLQLDTLTFSYGSYLDSGLIDDILEFHTDKFNTARSRLIDVTHVRYSSLADDQLRKLLRALNDAFLLTHVLARDGTPSYRLSHDTLGPVVRARFQESQRAGQRARRILEARVSQGPDLTSLDAVDLKIVERGLAGMRSLTPDEARLVSVSRRARWQGRLKSAASLIVTTVSAITLFSLVVPQARFPLFHIVHRWTVNAAADAALQGREDLRSKLGQELLSNYSCDWNQQFKAGSVIHPDATLFGMNPGRFERSAFVLQKNIQGAQNRWYWYHDHPVNTIPYSGINTFLDLVQHSATLPDNSGLAHLSQSELRGVPLSALCCSDVEHQVQGGLAFLYAKLNLRLRLGDPDSKQFQGSVLIRSYENGYVLAGAGTFSSESSIVYILLDDKGSVDHGVWIPLNKKPIFGSRLRPDCVEHNDQPAAK
jgi:hypothetical protein